ncbi:MAG: hypothetical protein AAF798_06020 [Bacteroidota bacterium]
MAHFWKEQQKRSENWEEHYPGNIWGWKFSLFGLVVIVLLLGLMIYRHITLDVPFGEPKTPTEQVED